MVSWNTNCKKYSAEFECQYVSFFIYCKINIVNCFHVGEGVRMKPL